MIEEEKTKLKTLLEYWIEHNNEHNEEFKEWADRTRVVGETEVSDEISQAVQQIDKANRLLTQALKRLGG